MLVVMDVSIGGGVLWIGEKHGGGCSLMNGSVVDGSSECSVQWVVTDGG